MGKDLLKRSLNDEITQSPKPTQIFSRDTKITTKTKQPKLKPTSIRCSSETADMINALSATLNLKTADEMIRHSIDVVLGELTPEEQTEYKTLKKVYTARRN